MQWLRGWARGSLIFKAKLVAQSRRSHPACPYDLHRRSGYSRHTRYAWLVSLNTPPPPPDSPEPTFAQARPGLRRRLRNVGKHPRFEWAWLLPCWAALGISRAAVLTVPFRRLAPRLGESRGSSPWIPLLTAAQQARAEQVGRVVRRTARFTPWNSNCFAQALTASLLLRVYAVPYTLHFGLAPDGATDEHLKAHAWVSSGPVKVCGGDGFARFTVVGCFAHPALPG